MNIRLGHVVSIIVFLASVSSGVSVAAQVGQSCVAQYKGIGYVEELQDSSPDPECYRLSPARPVSCEPIGPVIARYGLSGQPASSALAAPACMNPFNIATEPAGSTEIPDSVECTGGQRDVKLMECS